MHGQLNPLFITNILEIYAEEGRAWLSAIPEYLKQISNEWDIQILKIMSDLSYHFVALVEINATREYAVIKMAPPSANILTEIEWLRCIEEGVPKVYAHEKKFNAFLMEALRPGIPLKSLVKAGQDDAATKIICQIIRCLQTQKLSTSHFTHLAELASALPILTKHIDAKLLSQAMDWFHDLTQDRSQDVILHGDLHHDNVLSHKNNWKAIDPHGYKGEPAAEVGVMMRNPFDCFPHHQSLQKIITRRLHILADELPFDPKRMQAWSFCMTMLSIAWTFEGHGRIPELEVAIATAISKVKL